jgi:hypothetical protein
MRFKMTMAIWIKIRMLMEVCRWMAASRKVTLRRREKVRRSQRIRILKTMMHLLKKNNKHNLKYSRLVICCWMKVCQML